MPRFLFVLNQPRALRAAHTAAYLIAALIRRGVQVAVTDPHHLDWHSHDGPVARALDLPTWARQPFAVCRALQEALPTRSNAAIQSASADADDLLPLSAASWRPLGFTDIDALWLRCNPHLRRSALNIVHWAQVLVARGMLCLNAPAGLWRTVDKSHLFDLPAELRPRSLLSRNRDDLLNCIRFLGRTVVLKPAHGFGGEQVFIVERGRFDNLNAILDLLLLQGPVLVQEYLQAAADGDRRVLLWQGRAIEQQGQVALYRRMRPPGDLRNNLHIGGRRARCRFNRNDADAIDGIGAYLRRHGLWLAGADIVGGRILEINGWAPGGIHNIDELYGIRLEDEIAAHAIAALETHIRTPVLIPSIA